MKGAFDLGHPDDLSPEAYAETIAWVKEGIEAQNRKPGEDDEPSFDMDSEEGQALKT
jgi:hypothetical protein